jgi:hypothetical protein
VCSPIKGLITDFRLSWWFIGGCWFYSWVLAACGCWLYRHCRLHGDGIHNNIVIKNTQEKYIQITQWLSLPVETYTVYTWITHPPYSDLPLIWGQYILLKHWQHCPLLHGAKIQQQNQNQDWGSNLNLF